MRVFPLLAVWLLAPVLFGCGDSSHPLVQRHATDIRPLITKRCLACHAGPEAEAGVDLTPLAEHDASHPESVLERANRWERIAQVIELGVMPPEGEDPPTDAERRAVADWVQDAVRHAEASLPEVTGTTPLRRLNRSEYRATVRDLFGVDVDVTELLPPDDVGHGFDHLGEVLTVSPTHVEAYLAAAREISERVVIDIDPTRPMERTFSADELDANGRVRTHASGWKFTSTGTVSAHLRIPRGGRYRITVRAWAEQAGPQLARMRVAATGTPGEEIEVGARDGAAYDYEHVLELEPGPNDIGATFVNDYWQPRARDPRQRDRNLIVESIGVYGPLKAGLAPLPAYTEALLAPAGGERHDAALWQVAAPLLARAWRRPVAPEEIARVMVHAVPALEQSFGAALRRVVEAALLSPHFIFRVEDGGKSASGASDVALTPHERAVRLSYFLWGTMPDAALRLRADEGRLSSISDQREAIERMLADPRADVLVDRFALQWLGLLRLERATPDPKRFPTFTPALREAMLEETRRLVRDVFRNERDIRDLLDAKFTWMNETLATHYAMERAYAEAPAVDDASWRLVELPDGERRGILGHASVLTVTSYPTRTSPVQRGQYVLDTLLGRPPPPAPPGVGSLAEDETQAPADQARSVRDRLEQHRTDPACAACHSTMDALGFGLEPFDAIGRLRTHDLGHRIDASGVLPDGRAFDGPRALRTLLRDDPGVVRAFAERLLTYALGRGLTRRDGPAVRKILQEAATNGNTMRAFVMAVIASRAFQRRALPESQP